MSIQQPPLIDILQPVAAGTRGIPVVVGPYDEMTTYKQGEIVSYEGSSWSARVTTTGNPPPTLPTEVNTWWFIIAKGAEGQRGETGEAGPGFTSASVVGDNLIITRTTGVSFDAGNVRGASGTNGTNGSDGTGISSGNGAPASPAKVGDLYIDALTGDLYRWEA